jgi:hypothetical protein
MPCRDADQLDVISFRERPRHPDPGDACAARDAMPALFQ